MEERSDGHLFNIETSIKQLIEKQNMLFELVVLTLAYQYERQFRDRINTVFAHFSILLGIFALAIAMFALTKAYPDILLRTFTLILSSFSIAWAIAVVWEMKGLGKARRETLNAIDRAHELGELFRRESGNNSEA